MTEKTISASLEPEKLARRKFLGLASAALFAPVLAGCTLRSETFRYKLTLSLNTPDGVKTGSVVNEVMESHVYGFPQGEGYPYHERGQALFVDMGKGRKPLIGLLNYNCNFQAKCPNLDRDQQAWVGSWDRLGPTGIFQIRPELKGPRIPDPDASHADVVYQMDRWKQLRVHLDLRLEELPDLITFDDINDPLSVRRVDPWHLEETFGPGVSWATMTVDIVDDSTPVVFDLETKLPWIQKFRQIEKQNPSNLGLDGSPFGYGEASGKATLPNSIRMTNFERGRD